MIELPVLEPDAHREGRTLSRCREQLVQRRRRLERRAQFRAQSCVIERVLVAGVSILYLIALAGDLAGLYR